MVSAEEISTEENSTNETVEVQNTDAFDTSNLEPHPVNDLLVPQKLDSVAVYRLYNEQNGEHLFTTHLEEVATLAFGSHGPVEDWKLEGIAWSAPKEGTPVYRLYNPNLTNHLYTSDLNEIRVLTTEQGWQMDFDGVPVFYSGGGIAIYRLYNEGLSGMHHFTTDANEYNVLPQYEWKQEQVTCYCESIGVVSDAAEEAIRRTWNDCYECSFYYTDVCPSFHRLVKSLSDSSKEAEYMDVINRMNIDWDSNALWKARREYSFGELSHKWRDYAELVYYLELDGFTEEQALKADRLGK